MGRRVGTHATLLGLTLVGFVLRVDGLARQALWSDEDITLDRARLPLGDMLGALPVEHAPLYFAFMRPWTLLAGDGDFALRFPSALAGAIAIALAGYVGLRLFGRIAGITAALLVATQPFAISYGQEARMYSLLLVFCLAAPAAVLHAEVLDRRGAPSSRRWCAWAAAGALAALATLTHFYGALIAFVLGAWALHDVFWARDGASRHSDGDESAGALEIERGFASFRRAVTRRWALTGVVAAVVVLPWLPRALGVGGFDLSDEALHDPTEVERDVKEAENAVGDEFFVFPGDLFVVPRRGVEWRAAGGLGVHWVNGNGLELAMRRADW